MPSSSESVSQLKPAPKVPSLYCSPGLERIPPSSMTLDVSSVCFLIRHMMALTRHVANRPAKCRACGGPRIALV